MHELQKPSETKKYLLVENFKNFEESFDLFFLKIHFFKSQLNELLLFFKGFKNPHFRKFTPNVKLCQKLLNPDVFLSTDIIKITVARKQLISNF